MDDISARHVGDLYDSDFYGWTQRQAALLKVGDIAAADLSNILEEIETLGRKEVAELRSRYTVLATHLLKQRFQPAKSGSKLAHDDPEPAHRHRAPYGGQPELEVEGGCRLRRSLCGCPPHRRFRDGPLERNVSRGASVRPATGRSPFLNHGHASPGCRCERSGVRCFGIASRGISLCPRACFAGKQVRYYPPAAPRRANTSS